MESWQKDWAYNKYYVMSKSQNLYNEIRSLASQNNWDAEKDEAYHSLIKQAENTDPTLGSLKNTYQHVWGYFKKRCTKSEKDKFMNLINQLALENNQLPKYLKELTYKYEIEYLINSRLIQEIK